MMYDKKMKLDKEQRLTLIAEAVLQNVIDLMSNFVELLNELFDDCGHEAGRDKKEQIISDEVFDSWNRCRKLVIDPISIPHHNISIRTCFH